MADRLKGITVEIGGDTAGLSKALKEVNSESRGLQGELRDVEKLLKFDPSNTELLAQRQTILARQVETTSRKLQQLRDVEHQVQQQAARGDIGEEQYRRFQREIIETENRLRHFERQATETATHTRKSFKELGSDLGNQLAGAMGGAVAGMGINEVIQKSLETAHMETQIKVGFQVPEEEVGKVKAIVTSVNAMGVDTEAAMEGVRKQFALNIDKSTEQNEAIVKGAAAITQAYSGIDFNELIQESNEMAGSMEMSQEDALGMTNALLKMGFPPDQLDIISEYGAQLKRAGYNASEIQGIMAAGVDTKSWNIDKLLDGIKEGRIRLAKFGAGIDKTTATMIKGTDISAGELKKWGAAVAEGGDAGKVAMGEVALHLSKIQDSTKRNNIGIQLFGTMWEDTGKKITDTMINSSKYAGDATKNAQLLRDTTKGIESDPQVKLNQALQDMNTALTPLLTMVADWVTKIADWVSKNPELAAGITAAAVAMAILIGAVMSILPVVLGLMTTWGLLSAAFAFIISPIGLAIAAFAALIAIGVLVWKNFDQIKAKAVADWNELVSIIVGAGQRIKAKAIADWNDLTSKIGAAGQRIKKQWNDAVEDLKNIWNRVVKWFKGIDLVQTGKDLINGLGKGISSMASSIYKKAKEIATNIVNKVKGVFKTGSPSKVTMEIGMDVGDGLTIGLQNSYGKVASSAIDMANTVMDNLHSKFNWKDQDNVLTSYFEAIQEDGDYLNDMLTHMPKQVADIVRNIGKQLAPELEGTKTFDPYNVSTPTSKNITFHFNSPKALDTKEMQKAFMQTLGRMGSMW